MTSEPVERSSTGADRPIISDPPSRPLFVNIVIIVLTLAFSAGVFLGLELAR